MPLSIFHRLSSRNSPSIIAAVEVGTSKITVLVGEISHTGHLQIIGRGLSSSRGVCKGEITDLHAASLCTHAALAAAEKNASARIQQIYLALSGRHVEGFPQTGVTTVSATNNTVRAVDTHKAIENARNKELLPGRIYIHHIRNRFILDERALDNPIGMQGGRLQIDYWNVHADERCVSESLQTIYAYGLIVRDLILSSIASGSIVASQNQKQQGVLVIDIGAGITDYALYRNARIIRTGVIPIGGDHITNDLSIGLRIEAAEAEALKMNYQPDHKHHTAIQQITHARLSELFMILKNRLGSRINLQNIPAGIILTGGASKTQNIHKIAAETFGVDTHPGHIPNYITDPELRQPEFATALGLLHYAIRPNNPDTPEPAPKRSTLVQFFKRLWSNTH